MPIPNRRNDLQSFGYSFLNLSSCSGCGAEIEWWNTPRGRKMPFDVKPANMDSEDSAEILEPHWGTCPVADRFRGKR